MNNQPGRRILQPVFTLGVTLSLVGTVAMLHAQEPAKVVSGAPVRQELDEFREKVAKTFPADRLRDYDQGIEEVRKSGVLEKALKVGAKAPDFTLPNATGKEVRLADLLVRGPVVVTWYRGGWCPYCNIALRGFHKALPEIHSLGANMVAISPETPDNTMTTTEKNHLDFDVLSDKASKVAGLYGVAYKIPQVVANQFKGRLDLAKYNGDDSAQLPLGATYVIDRDGIIRYAFIDADYRKRAEPSDVLAALRSLEKKP